MTTGSFESRRKISFRRPEPLSHPTTTQAGETRRFADSYCETHTIHRIVEISTVQFVEGTSSSPVWRLRELVTSSGCITVGDMSWWVVRRGANALLHPKRMRRCKTQCSRDRNPTGWRGGSMLNGKMVWTDKETRTAPTCVDGAGEFIGSWERRWQRNEVALVTRGESEN